MASLFEPIRLRELALRNRIVISPRELARLGPWRRQGAAAAQEARP
ncbi:hypothetical protein [Enterovirga aerilata]|uniref:Uncharacterized protein n=1 Tax=Enterovirga aerilata TaxID=2730920 RepID=A0A849ICL6_9HYPH|nr:hypothetical protein [Enterovirga sp. DB1703]NNM75148.1 hypothetical protein [Enterovirga sp. DB1703]